MYLATFHLPVTSYQLRESVEDEGQGLRSTLVFDLGPDPARHFKVFDDRVVLFSDTLLTAVERYQSENTETILEQLLHPFLPSEIRFRNEVFRNRSRFRHSPLDDDERKRLREEIHDFDRRRLYYIRYGGVDQSRIRRMHEKCCRPLLGMSRDEREHYFQAEEQSLEPGEYLRYLHAALQLHRFFGERFAQSFPEALNRAKLSDRFVDSLCRLNGDATFWIHRSERPNVGSLHPHLVRYLVMFFDHHPRADAFSTDFVRRFMGTHRTFRWPESQRDRSSEDILRLFTVPWDGLKKLNKNELTRLFRKRAKTLHPDLGGNPEDFIALQDIYNQLLQKLP